MREHEGFARLVAIMDRLRGPEGCPWDREQGFDTLRSYLLEEAYEVAEALDRSDQQGLCEELGDLLFQIVFLARLATERQTFTIDDVVRGIAEKMVRRHPHVFGAAVAETSADVLRNWEAIKREERASSGAPDGRRSLLEGIPAALPALLKAQRLGTKAARIGFDWGRPQEVLDKVQEELDELRGALAGGEPHALREELGDVLFALAMLARHVAVDPEGALEGANLKFKRRFAWIEEQLERRGIEPAAAGLALLEQLWREAKSAERA